MLQAQHPANPPPWAIIKKPADSTSAIFFIYFCFKWFDDTDYYDAEGQIMRRIIFLSELDEDQSSSLIHW